MDAVSLTPALFTSAAADSPDTTVLRPSDWNRVSGLLGGVFSGVDADNALMPTTLQTPGASDGAMLWAGTPRTADATRKVTEHRWNKVGATASPNLTFSFALTGFSNLSSQDNHVFELGHNLSPGGGLVNASYSGVRDAWENYYEPSISGTGYWERHISAMPTDVLANGEIRVMSVAGRANQTRNNVHPTTLFQSEYWDWRYPSTGGAVNGPSCRLLLDGTNYGAAWILNNGYCYFRRGGISQGVNYPLFFQLERSSGYDMRALWWDTGSNDMHLFWADPSAATASALHTGNGGVGTRFIVDGKNSANLHGWILFRDEQGAGTKESFLHHDDTSLYLGAPQAALANYNDTTIIAAATLKVLTTGVALLQAPAFVAGDKYVTIDSNGNLHRSAIGPAS